MTINVELNPREVWTQLTQSEKFEFICEFFECDDLDQLTMEEFQAIKWALDHRGLIVKLRKEAI